MPSGGKRVRRVIFTSQLPLVVYHARYSIYWLLTISTEHLAITNHDVPSLKALPGLSPGLFSSVDSPGILMNHLGAVSPSCSNLTAGCTDSTARPPPLGAFSSTARALRLLLARVVSKNHTSSASVLSDGVGDELEELETCQTATSTVADTSTANALPLAALQPRCFGCRGKSGDTLS